MWTSYTACCHLYYFQVRFYQIYPYGYNDFQVLFFSRNLSCSISGDDIHKCNFGLHFRVSSVVQNPVFEMKFSKYISGQNIVKQEETKTKTVIKCRLHQVVFLISTICKFLILQKRAGLSSLMRNLLHPLETFIITARSFSVRKERMILARCLVKTLSSSLERMSRS